MENPNSELDWEDDVKADTWDSVESNFDLSCKGAVIISVEESVKLGSAHLRKIGRMLRPATTFGARLRKL